MKNKDQESADHQPAGGRTGARTGGGPRMIGLRGGGTSSRTISTAVVRGLASVAVRDDGSGVGKGNLVLAGAGPLTIGI